MRKNKKLILISSIFATTAMVAVPAISIVNNINTVIDSQLDNVVQNNQRVEMDGIDSNINTVEGNVQVKDIGDKFEVSAAALMNANWGKNITGDLVFTIIDDVARTVNVEAKDKTIFKAADFSIQSIIVDPITTTTYNVTSINANAFKSCSGLTGALTIPASVASIGNRAFFECNFASISIDSNNKIFSKATNLGKDCHAIINNKIGLFGNETEAVGSLAIGQLEIPTSVTSFAWGAFEACSGLTSVTIPPSVTTIANQAFQYCSGLTVLDLTKATSLQSIGGSAFDNCSGLSSVTIPASVTTIGDGAFTYCSGLSSVSFPASVTSISDDAFFSCSGLTALDLSSATGLKNIGGFIGCTSLTNIIIPASATAIISMAFRDCQSITDITVLATTPPAISGDSFDIFTPTLHVPVGSEELYKNHNIWSKFKIEPIPTPPVPDPVKPTDNLNLPLIIGATVGGATVILAAIAGVVTYVTKRNKKDKKDKKIKSN